MIPPHMVVVAKQATVAGFAGDVTLRAACLLDRTEIAFIEFRMNVECALRPEPGRVPAPVVELVARFTPFRTDKTDMRRVRKDREAVHVRRGAR